MRRFVLDLLDLGVALLGQQVFRLAVILLPHLAFGIGIVQVFELLFVVAVRLLHRPGDIGSHVQHLFVPFGLRFGEFLGVLCCFVGCATATAAFLSATAATPAESGKNPIESSVIRLSCSCRQIWDRVYNAELLPKIKGKQIAICATSRRCCLIRSRFLSA